MPRTRSILSPAPKGSSNEKGSSAPKRRNIPALGNRTPKSLSPEGAWPLVAIRDITRHHSGNSKLIKGKLFDSPGPGRFVGFSASGQDVWRDDFDREGDAIIVSAVGARCGKCFIARGQWSAVANTHVVWPDEEKVDLKYLWYLLNDENFWVRSGSAQPFVATRKTFEKEIPLPPLPEQRRIVARIEELFSRLDAGVAALRHAKAQLQRYRQSVLAAAVTGQLTQEWREQHPDTEPAADVIARTETPPRPNRYKTRSMAIQKGHPALSIGNPGTPLPKGWTWAHLVEIARMESGHTPSRNHPEWWDGDIPWIGIADARENHGKIIHETFQHTNEEGLANSASRLLPAGTVCISRTASVGYVTIMGREMATSQDFVNWIPTSAVTSDWLRVVFQADTEGLRSFGSGSVHKTIYFPEWLSMHAAIPPLAEQQQIVAEVEARTTAIDHLEAELDRQITRSNRLRQATLSEAFCGKL